jgi:hypothetical protein
MFILDENISESEVWRLREAGLAVRVFGVDLGEKSDADEEIIPLLHRLKQPTFFTKDGDFWDRTLLHAGYCLVRLDVPEHEGEVAAAIRRFLRHPLFNTHAKRLGKVVHVYAQGAKYWQLGRQGLQAVAWDSR